MSYILMIVGSILLTIGSIREVTGKIPHDHFMSAGILCLSLILWGIFFNQHKM